MTGMKQCSKCGQTKELTAFNSRKRSADGKDAQCRECVCARRREIYATKPDHFRRYALGYYYAHHETIRMQQRRRYPFLSPRSAETLHKNRLRARIAYRRWAKDNHSKVVELTARRRARIRRATIGSVSYEAIYRRDKSICHICKNPVPRSRLHFDHVIPLAKGGTHTMGNIAVSHAVCNLKKGARLVGQEHLRG
jgi:hypothetical protein